MNKLLERQIRKYLGEFNQVPKNFTAVFNAISESYDHYEKDRKMIERSIDLSSKEMIELNNQVKKEKDELFLIASRLKQAQTIAHIGNWELKFATGTCIWSDEACLMYGIPIEESTQQTFNTWISFIHPEDLDYVKKEIEKSQASLSGCAFEHRIICKDGKVKHIHSVSSFEFTNGKPVGLFGICHDITERKESEKKIIQSEIKIKNFAQHLNNTIENERGYIAREIHDELGQYLTGLKLGMSSLQNQIKGNDKINTRIENIINNIEAGQQSVRKLATKLRPAIIDTLGLTQSIAWLAQEFEKSNAVKCHLEIDKNAEGAWKPHISICFFRICQESLTNITKHAEASEVIIKIQKTENKLILIISDNGKGILNEKLANPFSMGLLGMRERANLINANLQIKTKEKKGTTIQLELKIN